MSGHEKTPGIRSNEAEGKETFLDSGLHLKDSAHVSQSVSDICNRYGCQYFGRRHDPEDTMPEDFH